MVKNGYVNNLAEMREQLRRNYRNPDDVVETSRMEIPASETPSESAPVVLARSEAHRDFRDLEGRTISALALIENELARAEFVRNQLAEQRDKLKMLLQDMQSVSRDANEAEYRKKVDALRYRFFEIAVPASGKGDYQTENADLPKRRDAVVVALAVVLGAIIVAFAVFFAF